MTAPVETSRPARITCILPKGRAVKLVRWLHESRGIDAANVSAGRGRGIVESISYGDWDEVEILTVLVDGAMAETLFEELYFEAGIDRPEGGLMHLARLDRRTGYELPDEVAEETSSPTAGHP